MANCAMRQALTDWLERTTPVTSPHRPPPSEPSELDALLGFQLRRAYAACNRQFAEAFAQLALTQKQVALLWLISDFPGIAQIDLGQRLHMDRATTMGMVNRLQERGLLRRERSPQDGRKQALFLEPAGQSALDAAKDAVAEHERWITARFTPAEAKLLRDLLARFQP